MANIAILGTRESGKTVLMTVLARRYRNRNGDAPFLRYEDPETMGFTERNWHQLAVERAWPPLTQPGALFKLQWSLEHGGQSHQIRLLDFAGETFAELFGRHRLTEAATRQQQGANPAFGPLLDYLDRADVVLLLVNLRDYANTPGSAAEAELLIRNQWALRGALDYLVPRLGQRAAVVLTQIGQYMELLGGRTPKTVMAEQLAATQITDIYPDLRFLAVDAVGATEQGLNGETPTLRPAANFPSWHLEDLMDFVVEAAAATEQQRQAAAQAEQRRQAEEKRLAAARQAEQERQAGAKRRLWMQGAVAAVVVALLAGWGVWREREKEKQEAEVRAQHERQEAEARAQREREEAASAAKAMELRLQKEAAEAKARAAEAERQRLVAEKARLEAEAAEREVARQKQEAKAKLEAEARAKAQEDKRQALVRARALDSGASLSDVSRVESSLASYFYSAPSADASEVKSILALAKQQIQQRLAREAALEKERAMAAQKQKELQALEDIKGAFSSREQAIQNANFHLQNGIAQLRFDVCLESLKSLIETVRAIVADVRDVSTLGLDRRIGAAKNTLLAGLADWDNGAVTVHNAFLDALNARSQAQGQLAFNRAQRAVIGFQTGGQKASAAAIELNRLHNEISNR